MRYGFTFTNLFGSVYREGNVVFLHGGDLLLSPVGRRVTGFDFKRNCSKTFPFESIQNIERIAVSPDESLMIVVGKDGRALLVSLLKLSVLHQFNFKKQVQDIKYSPCGRFICSTHGRHVQVWHSPGNTKDFSPFQLFHTFSGLHDDAVSIDWSWDSRFVIVGSKDMTAKIYSIGLIPGFSSVTLSGHRHSLVACFFQWQSLNVYTVATDCAVYVWYCQTSLDQLDKLMKQQALQLESNVGPENESFDVSSAKVGKLLDYRWELSDRHLFLQKHTTISCAQLHHTKDLLVLGFANGVFSLYEMPHFQLIHSLSISNQSISSVCVNQTGEWLAFGCSDLGQLVVWEWQSESFILKQQGHYYDVNVLGYSPDGQWIATGGDDGKVKLWDTVSGFCFVTFHKHIAGVTGVVWGNSGQFVLSSSLDGTVRAFDVHRYRNFRTFTSPHPVQFSCVAVGTSSDVVYAGSQDTFEVFVWSVQTGRLLEILPGHEGPVSSLAVSLNTGIIASSSWDKTVRVWDVFERNCAVDVLTMSSDALGLCFCPVGHELAVTTLDGNISLWNIDSLTQVGTIECQRDVIGSHRRAGHGYFSSVCYSSDGSCLLAGGKSRFVCLYSVSEQVLLKKFVISKNTSTDSSLLLECGLDSVASVDPSPVIDWREGGREDTSLPGVFKGDLSESQTRFEPATKCLQFSPTDMSWAAATGEGLLIYSLDQQLMFHPFDLSRSVTPDAVVEALFAREYCTALVMALTLNESMLIKQVLEAISQINVAVVANSVPSQQVELLLEFIASQLESSRCFERYLCWCSLLLSRHALSLKQRSSTISRLVQTLQRSISRHLSDLGSLSNDNTHLLQFLVSVGDAYCLNKSEHLGDHREPSLC